MGSASENIPSSIGVMRELFVLGDRLIAKEIIQSLLPLNFLHQKPVSTLAESRHGLHFIVIICNFQDFPNMHLVARSLTKLDSADAHKIVYATEPAALDQQHLLFGIELGARFTVYGPNKDFHLKEYIKRISLAAQTSHGLSSLEAEIGSLASTRDDRGLQKVADKLLQLPKDREDILRLQTLTAQHLRLPNKAIYYLIKILTINPQNLWAAWELGNTYLRSDKIVEGIEALEKLSQFRDLNSGQALKFDEAYLNSEKAKKAEHTAEIRSATVAIDGGSSPRSQGELAKTSIIGADRRSTLSILGKPTLSEAVLGFITLRAALAIKNGQLGAGIRFYQMALDGCHDAKKIQSKLWFNMGLAYSKLGNVEAAILSFQSSLELGGTEFSRAKGPLEISIRALEKHQKALADGMKIETTIEANESEVFDSLDQFELNDLEV
jgi:tetratricopeptide (TPR) repeat protein